MSEAFVETTVWEESFQPNHTYLLEGDKAIAYIKKGGTEPFYFNKPIVIDKRRRTFKKLETNPFNVVANPDLIEVTGSKGETYYVNPADKSCTCSGYKFRGNCKHLTIVKEIK